MTEGKCAQFTAEYFKRAAVLAVLNSIARDSRRKTLTIKALFWVSFTTTNNRWINHITHTHTYSTASVSRKQC